ncbi:hypothetical protein Pmani_000034 [Petrolisthes manimaculis]|uniref:Bromo domain-containing protein n=1 Tax=Petrolisthes manimaculis TaxID=1843537 RepID=A0AAE1UQR4_9EUCA|nr:hypothetical protein Pmani_000034 [Petrolisthes manimaculis]
MLYLLLPRRYDWLGNEQKKTFEELDIENIHLRNDHLAQMVARLGPAINQLVPLPYATASTLLGAGSQSLLRTHQDLCKSYPTLKSVVVRRSGGQPLLEPHKLSRPPSLVLTIVSCEYTSHLRHHHVHTNEFHRRMELFLRSIGHLSAVYCMLFDKSGKYIITGADDTLVKIWSTLDGRLLATLRGASAEISDLAIDSENTLIAAGSCDKIIRVWNLQTLAPIAVLSSHTGMVTAVQFCPAPDNEGVLVSTGGDGCVAFWTYTRRAGEVKFDSKPLKVNERVRPGNAQLICASFSQGGHFLALGGADHFVRVYQLGGEEGVDKLLETERHQDRVDSIQWCHRGLMFVSGSRDGTALIWYYERQQWKNVILNMAVTLPGDNPTMEEQRRLQVTMVGWNRTDEYVITASNDKCLRVWESRTGRLQYILRGHEDNAYVIEAHPFEARLILSAAHDGQLMIWDIFSGSLVWSFKNTIEGQGYGALFDAKWSPDGFTIAATDSHGHLILFGIGHNEKFQRVPKELFFHTDYRKLMRDGNNHVLDEHTQMAPHLMPPPFLVNMDGDPYPPEYQRLVPGRESCRHDQLIPNVLLNANGTRGVGVVEDATWSTGNWQRDPNMKWKRRTIVPRLNRYDLERSVELRIVLGKMELIEFDEESHKKPEPARSPQHHHHHHHEANKKSKKKQKKQTHSYSTRSVRETSGGFDFEEVDHVAASSSSGSSSGSEVENEELQESTSSDDQSTDYSDWTAEAGVNLEPPKRTAHKQKKNPKKKQKGRGSNDEADQKDEDDEEDEDEDKTKFKPGMMPVPRSQRKRGPRLNLSEISSGGADEIPEEFRPPEWLTEIYPKKAPYFPQMGDELIYFMQGHMLYAEAVMNRHLYTVDQRNLPWTRTVNKLRHQEFVKIIGIKYEIKPPRLCCLKLGIMDVGSGKLQADSFTIKYHDMPDVLDFLVLKATYDVAVMRHWRPGDRFRCIIDDAWWLGTVESQEPHLPEFQDSMFMCYRVLWDNGERERLSPWDMELIDDHMEAVEPRESVVVKQEELEDLFYTLQDEEWTGRDPDLECDRISHGLSKIMSLSIAEPFLVPVDLYVYPTYAFIIEYPMDLTTIKSRLDSRFYRRINAVQFDVRYIATNTEKFNQKGSTIVRQARIVTELCLKLIKDGQCVDPTPLYHDLQANYHSPDHSDNPDHAQDGIAGGKGGHIKTKGGLRSRGQAREDNRSWQQKCKDLLRSIFEMKDSMPFRYPVDLERYPDYSQVIDVPMDLTTVREELSANGYLTPHDFAKDVRLIFTNSKKYNTNKRSLIYSMTLRLEAYFENQLRPILSGYKSQGKRNVSKNIPRTAKRRVPPVTIKVVGGRAIVPQTAGGVGGGGSRRSSPALSSGLGSGGLAQKKILKWEEEEEEDSEEAYSPRNSPSTFTAKAKKKKVVTRSRGRVSVQYNEESEEEGPRDDNDRYDDNEEDSSDESSTEEIYWSGNAPGVNNKGKGRPQQMKAAAAGRGKRMLDSDSESEEIDGRQMKRARYIDDDDDYYDDDDEDEDDDEDSSDESSTEDNYWSGNAPGLNKRKGRPQQRKAAAAS